MIIPTYFKCRALVIGFIALSIATPVYSQEENETVSDQIKEIVEESGLPGCAVAIVSAEGVWYQDAFGYSDLKQAIPFSEATALNIGSVSKLFVGLAVVKAVQAGRLSMDTKINEVLPFEIMNPNHPDKPILLRHLLNHTSSIQDGKYYRNTYVLDKEAEKEKEVHPGYLAFLQSHEMMEQRDFLFDVLNEEGKWYKKKTFLKATPGDLKAYANLNAALAALIVEEATEKSFNQFTDEVIFSELSLSNTQWDLGQDFEKGFATRYFPSGVQVPDYRLITYPDGGLVSSVEDLSAFLMHMIQSFSGKSEYLTGPYNRVLFPGDEDDQRAFWGMGSKSRNIGHGGSDPGAQADLQFNADSKVGRVILCNVNAEDNSDLWDSYQAIHKVLAEYEKRLVEQMK